MSILCDHEIRNAGMVEGYDPALINPASLDLRLGGTIMIESAEDLNMRPLSIADRTADDPYWLRPGQFVLACTLEQVNFTADIGGQFLLKSSRAREGLNHLMAGWIDPGFRGALTLELHNVRQLQSQPLWPGMRIGQLIVHYLASQPGRSYAETGRYLGDTTVQESRG
jgi:dCTP deaminase